MTDTSTSTRPAAATVVGALAVVGVVGAIVMTVAHLDLDVPGISRLGPGRSLPPVAGGFALGAALFAIVAYGAFRRTAWAWPLALVVNGLAFLSSIFPVRGVEALVPAAVTFAAVVVLVSRPGREALLYRRDGQP